MNKSRSAYALLEISVVILAGFVVSYVMTRYNIRVFAGPHLAFIALAIIFRTLFGKWKLSDWGIAPDVGKQIIIGLLLWLIVQVYYTFGHLFAPLFPEAVQMGARAYGVTSIEALGEKLLLIAFFKAGTLETFRYFGYAEGLLMQSFGAPLGAIMTFFYFGSAHMGIMNLIVLPVSFLFVYYYRTYKLIIPLIVFHVLGDAGAFTQMYLSSQEMYVYNYGVFMVFAALLFIFRKKIKEVLRPVKQAVLTDLAWIKGHMIKTVLLVLVLPIWLYFLLYIEKIFQP